MPGSAGRYMSVEMGPSAVSEASRMVSAQVSGFSMETAFRNGGRAEAPHP